MRSARFWAGVGWGVVATIAMSIVMILAMLAGVSPMPKPIPIALVARTLGEGIPKPVLMALGIVLHLGYGGLFGGLLAISTRAVTVLKALALGVGLWLLMQVLWLPYLGWGVFGTNLTPKIAVATLVLHLIYGGTLGALADRHVATAPVAA
jgi:hypothetical protein